MNTTDHALKRLSDHLLKSVKDHPDQTALVCHDQRISYREFGDKVELVARFLLKLGVKKHDRIAYMLETQPEFFCLFMAAARIGAIMVGLGTKLMPPELEYIIKNAQAHYVFVTGGDRLYLQRLEQIIGHCREIKKVVVVGDNPEGSRRTCFHDIFQQDYADYADRLLEREAQVDADDGLLMVYTSGTTGQPKGALLTHGNIIYSSRMEAAQFNSSKDDVWLDNMPVNHVGGAIVQGVTPLFTASTVVLVPSFSPAQTLELIERERVTILGGVPTMYAMEMNLANYDDYDKSSLRIAHFGGSMPPRTTIEKVSATMTSHIYNCLGMTECAGIITYTPDDLSTELLSKSLGQVMPGIEWKLVDKERKTVPPGEVGELAFRGPTIIKEYYRHPKATDESFDEDGWFYGGDLFYEDENGLLIFMGRKKEMFVTGGENVYIAEVEGVICSYKPVQTVALVPAPDPVYGEIGYAFIIPREGCTIDEADLKAYLQKRLASYKIPRKFVFRSQLPLNPVGKVAKQELIREIMAE